MANKHWHVAEKMLQQVLYKCAIRYPKVKQSWHKVGDAHREPNCADLIDDGDAIKAKKDSGRL